MDVFYQNHHFKNILWRFQIFDVCLPKIVILHRKKSGPDFVENDPEIKSFLKINFDYFDYFPVAKKLVFCWFRKL